MMVATPKFELMEIRLGRPLGDQLRTWRTAGVSAPAAARLLHLETGMKVSSETVLKWYRVLGTAA